MTSKSLPRVFLKFGKAKPLWAGHPWVYSGAIANVQGDVSSASLVEVCDQKGELIGTGTWNPDARIAVRMLGPGITSENIEQTISERIERARLLRQRCGLPNDETTAYRLVNGEGDELPGLIIDVFGDYASVQFTTAVAEGWRSIVLDALPHSIVHCAVPEDSARMEGILPGDRLGRGDREEHVSLLENGIEWRLKPGKGQKTGFYTDQRDNRQRLRTYVAGKRVLDCYTYTGGFALNAARSGASHVVGVDSSGPNISVARGTAELNGLDVEFHHEDAIRYLKAEEDPFDVVILDPPKLARRRAGLDQAYAKYRAINVAGMQRVAADGILVSCSCSGLVDSTMFLRMLSDAAHLAGRRITLLDVQSTGGDHPTPVAFAEGRYLKVVFARVG
jgi:23S rRNA (cytosine1962-C5)-methyltransferase